ncbi:MAG: phosphotransferase [Candidatus Alcyoniella australis]|nr:phosphotransferase [Candidatus Alcyoniella australis]
MSEQRFEISADGRYKIREFASERDAARAERYLSVLNVAKVGSPRLIERQGARLIMEYVDAQPLSGRLGLSGRRTLAELMAQIHGLRELDLPLEQGLAGYREQSANYLQRYIEAGLLDQSEADQLAQRLMALTPKRMFAALVHDDLHARNVLRAPAGLVLIDYAGVKALSLEHDLLNASYSLLTSVGARLYGRYSLRGYFVRSYARQSTRCVDVLKSAQYGLHFYEAFNRLRKGSNALSAWRGAKLEPAQRALEVVRLMVDQ